MKQLVVRFLRDERGDEGVNKLLILAFIAIPLIALLIIFKDEIIGWAQDIWNEVFGSGPTKPERR